MRSGAPNGTRAPRRQAAPLFRLRLYVAGQSPRSLTALDNLRRLCDAHPAGRFRIEVVDLLEHPHRARRDRIIAIPTLVRRAPLPQRRLVGDLSDGARAVAELELPVARDGR